jgi:nitroreductase
MTVEETIRARRSIRQYDSSAPVPHEDLDRVLEAGRLAPSGINMQPWTFIAVRDPELKARLADEAMLLEQNTDMCHQAPVLLVCCAKLDAHTEIADRLRDLAQTGLFDPSAVDELAGRYRRSFERMADEARQEYAATNAAIAMTQMILQATELGYGTCWLGGFSEKRVRRILNVPDTLRVFAITPVGRPAEAPPARRRKPLEEIVVRDRFPDDGSAGRDPT